ncbi:helix-turn-helix transcriptional regulator [uncultured Methanobacterium sp.]|uniref:PadR family transcriptional regulator n=1 Tax=uncultured Methanobacterium sp. TaxID=176306 RepID=UPI002AA91058|nr:helix-turn-helix transcriptional regulator [uncultured Methanobacterium sp.]
MVNTELIILGMISYQPSHGYLLKKNVSDCFGNPYFKLNNNVLYSTLAKLEKNGFIIGKEMPNEKINKKVYHITEEGKKHLVDLVSTPVKPGTDDFSFLVQTAFMDIITPEKRIKVVKPLYESKMILYQEVLEKKEKNASNMLPVSRIALDYGIKELENALEFYEKLMNREK